MIDAPQLSTCITNDFIFFFDLFKRVFGQLFFNKISLKTNQDGIR